MWRPQMSQQSNELLRKGMLAHIKSAPKQTESFGEFYSANSVQYGEKG